MKHISQILEELSPSLQVQHEDQSFCLDSIRKEKAFLIEDIFRVMKASCQMNSIYIDLISYNGCIKTFNELYDMTIYDLELLLAHLSAELKCWMKECQSNSMRSKFIPNYQYKRNTFRSNPEDDLN